VPGRCNEHPPGYHKHQPKKQNVYDNKTRIKKNMPQQQSTGLARRIQAARKRLNLSQNAAASAWGFSKRTLQQWEQGRREPRGLYLEKIENILAECEAKRKPRPGI